MMTVKVSRILHAGYVFECHQTQIAFDPIFENPFSRNCFSFPHAEFDHQKIRLLKLDAIFISHFHDDHCSLVSLNLLDRNTSIYMYCQHPEIFNWLSELGFKQVYSLNLNETVSIGPFQVTTRPALDVHVDSIFHIQAVGLNILNVVDSWIDDETLNILKKEKWDLILWPFQALREIEVLSPINAPSFEGLPSEWMAQLKILKPKALVPSSCQFIHESWSWYNQALFPVSYSLFEREMKNILPETLILRLDPGAAIKMDSVKIESAERLSWVIGTENLSIDYDYQPSRKPSATSEIAKNFPALEKDQYDLVYKYCKQDLIKKFKDIRPSQDLYFNKSRCWKLSLYNHLGFGTNFYYYINNDDIEVIEYKDQCIEWTTEISVYKLYNALTCGESLTSMYLRVNNANILDVDPTEDPLIRCLSDGAALSYQAAQFRKLVLS